MAATNKGREEQHYQWREKSTRNNKNKEDGNQQFEKKRKRKNSSTPFLKRFEFDPRAKVVICLLRAAQPVDEACLLTSRPLLRVTQDCT